MSLGTNATIVAIADLYSHNNLDWGEICESPTDKVLLRDLCSYYGCEYDTTRFFSKRIPCKCLKEKYSRVKARSHNRHLVKRGRIGSNYFYVCLQDVPILLCRVSEDPLLCTRTNLPLIDLGISQQAKQF